MYFIYISTTFFFYTKIEEIKTITTPIIATDNPPIDNGIKLELIILDFQYISCFSFTLNSEHSLPASDYSIENVFIKLYC